MRGLGAILAAALALPAGCEGGGTQLKQGELSGKVTLDGQPVAHGMVRFLALDPNGLNVAARITNGEFKLGEGEGPAKGKYRVEFSVPSPTKKTKMKNPDNEAKWLEEPVEVLPPRFHKNSQITFDYDPQNPRPFNYDLSSH